MFGPAAPLARCSDRADMNFIKSMIWKKVETVDTSLDYTYITPQLIGACTACYPFRFIAGLISMLIWSVLLGRLRAL